MKINLLKNTAFVAIVSCSLGLIGCTVQQDEDYDLYAKPQPACLDNTGMECVLISDSQTALYLPEFSEQTYTVMTTETVPVKKTYYGSQSGVDLSVSSPATQEGAPVRVQPTKTTSAVTIKTTEAATITPSVSVEIEAPKVEPVEEVKTQAEPVAVETPDPQTQTEQVSVETPEPQTQTIQTTTVEIEEKTQTAITTKDTSLSAKASYGEKCHDWEAKAGDTLRALLMQWGEKSGWTVIWKLDRDYHLEAGVIFRGTFTEVSGALIRSFARATPAPIGTFYKGNRVLVISTQEDENAN